MPWNPAARRFSGAMAVMRRCSRCSVINPSAVTACNALSGYDIFQHQSRNELASMPMANQGCRRRHTLAHLLMAFSIKPEPPRCKIAILIGTCVSSERGADRQLTGFPTRQNIPQNSRSCLKICHKIDSEDLARTLTGFYIFIFKYFPVGELPKLVNNRTQNDCV